MKETQDAVDSFYKLNGNCCAGCDWWRFFNSVLGECIKSAPVSGSDRMSMTGMYLTSVNVDSGHIITNRDHLCGDFKDNL